jgi:diguanylate cyclase (GGDEF)-like protein
MSPDISTSLHGLLLQAIGIGSLALLSFLLSRSIQRDYLRYWWQAWTSLAVSLVALFLALRLPGIRAWVEPVYFMGEYVFGGLLVAGCRSVGSGAPIRRRAALLLVPALGLALLLPHLHREFSIRFIPQAAIMAILFGTALVELRRAPSSGEGRIGLRLLKVSLLALTLLFLHYVPVLLWASRQGHELAAAYSSSTSLFDLLLEILLGFGTVIVVMEREHRALEEANEELRGARAKLETLARLDPLTHSLNRHAFYSMVEGSRADRGGAGCVAVADVDSLKAINDRFGHAAGDAAIRAVARAIRQVVRADDLVFRWGGDEFLVVLFGVSEQEAASRLEALEGMLSAVPLPVSGQPLAVTASTGVAAFDSLETLEHASETADDRMYRRKEARHLAEPPPVRDR